LLGLFFRCPRFDRWRKVPIRSPCRGPQGQARPPLMRSPTRKACLLALPAPIFLFPSVGCSDFLHLLQGRPRQQQAFPCRAPGISRLLFSRVRIPFAQVITVYEGVLRFFWKSFPWPHGIIDMGTAGVFLQWSFTARTTLGSLNSCLGYGIQECKLQKEPRGLRLLSYRPR